MKWEKLPYEGTTPPHFYCAKVLEDIWIDITPMPKNSQGHKWEVHVCVDCCSVDGLHAEGKTLAECKKAGIKLAKTYLRAGLRRLG